MTSAADREIVTTRVVDAPRERVWRAWTERAQVAQWWGPNGFTNTIHEMDLRPGGVWQFVMHGPDGAPSKAFFAAGSFLAQGDHASHLWKSFTCEKTTAGGAEIVADRTTRKSEGWSATTPANSTTTTASPTRIFTTIVISLPSSPHAG